MPLVPRHGRAHLDRSGGCRSSGAALRCPCVPTTMHGPTSPSATGITAGRRSSSSTAREERSSSGLATFRRRAWRDCWQRSSPTPRPESAAAAEPSAWASSPLLDAATRAELERRWVETHDFTQAAWGFQKIVTAMPPSTPAQGRDRRYERRPHGPGRPCGRPAPPRSGLGGVHQYSPVATGNTRITKSSVLSRRTICAFASATPPSATLATALPSPPSTPTCGFPAGPRRRLLHQPGRRSAPRRAQRAAYFPSATPRG